MINNNKDAKKTILKSLFSVLYPPFRQFFALCHNVQYARTQGKTITRITHYYPISSLFFNVDFLCHF